HEGQEEQNHENHHHTRQVIHYWRDALADVDKMQVQPSQLKESELFSFYYIIHTYDQYIFDKNKKIPRLLNKFCSLKDNKHPEERPLKMLFMASQHHLGQMQKYPLSSAQRVNLSYLSESKGNSASIFTIDGLPGSGKTTLLLSIIASKWVEAAVNKS